MIGTVENEGKHSRRKVGEKQQHNSSDSTFLLCDRNWCVKHVPSGVSATSRVDGPKPRTHTHQPKTLGANAVTQHSSRRASHLPFPAASTTNASLSLDARRPESATPAATAATAGDTFQPELSDPVEVFPLDTELRREIGAAVDAEMHRDLAAALAAATVAPGTALDPDVAAVHERVVEEEQARVAGVSVNFDDASASYVAFTDMELLR